LSDASLHPFVSLSVSDGDNAVMTMTDTLLLLLLLLLTSDDNNDDDSDNDDEII